MPVVNLTKSTWLATKISKADTFATRLVGLLRRRSLNPDEALWLVPCKGVHTFGMKFPIDVLFLNRRGSVVQMLSRLAPRSFSGLSWRSHSVLELPEGVIEKSNTEIGDAMDVSVAQTVAFDGLRESRLTDIRY